MTADEFKRNFLGHWPPDSSAVFTSEEMGALLYIGEVSQEYAEWLMYLCYIQRGERLEARHGGPYDTRFSITDEEIVKLKEIAAKELERQQREEQNP